MTLEQLFEFGGQIAPDEARRISEQEGKTLDELTVGLLPLARKLARPLISGFEVGAVVQGVTGALYLGANLEIPGNVLGMTVHAEQAAVANAFMSGEKQISAIAVTTTPCGHCRQFLYEFAGDRDIRILMENAASTLLAALLPDPFGPKDLGLSVDPFSRRSHLLSAGATSELAIAALDAANKSYAPYSKSPAGVAVKTRRGRIYQGSYLENAAFNPSLSPLQVALVRMAAAGEAFDNITNATLVEIKDARISQTNAARVVLAVISPDATLDIAYAYASGRSL